MKRKKSVELYRRASGLIPGGVNSPVRAFRAIGISPIFVDRADSRRPWVSDFQAVSQPWQLKCIPAEACSG